MHGSSQLAYKRQHQLALYFITCIGGDRFTNLLANIAGGSNTGGNGGAGGMFADVDEQQLYSANGLDDGNDAVTRKLSSIGGGGGGGSFFWLERDP